jgi:SPP1 family predicted phage head-tail adaptor
MMEFPHTVTFQKFEKVPDGGGGHIEEWSDYLTTEAFVCPVDAKEMIQSQQTSNPVNHSVFYPYQEGVKGDMRVIWHDRDETLKVRSAPLDQGGQGEIMAVKCNG